MFSAVARLLCGRRSLYLQQNERRVIEIYILLKSIRLFLLVVILLLGMIESAW